MNTEARQRGGGLRLGAVRLRGLFRSARQNAAPLACEAGRAMGKTQPSLCKHTSDGRGGPQPVDRSAWVLRPHERLAYQHAV